MTKLAALLILMFSWMAQAAAPAPEIHQVFKGNPKTIIAHGIAKKVVNNCAQNIMIPTKTAAEWNRFIDRHPNCVTVTNAQVTIDLYPNGCGGKLCSCHSSTNTYSQQQAKQICLFNGYAKLVDAQWTNGPIGQIQCPTPDGSSGCFTNQNSGNYICTSVTCE